MRIGSLIFQLRTDCRALARGMAVASAAVLAFAGQVAAQQCPVGRCPAVPGSPSIFGPLASPADGSADTPKVVCGRNDGDPKTRWRFWVEGREVGYYDVPASKFYPVDDPDGAGWELGGGACRCNGKCDCSGCKPAGDKPTGAVFGQLPACPPGGIDADRLKPDGAERFTINGRRVDRGRAIESLLGGSGNLIDDSGFLRLTVIGSDAERKRVLDDLKGPALAGLAGGLLVRDYPPDHWAVKDAGFKVDGRPTIYVQHAGGKVLHRQDDYDGGPDRLAGAIRKARPDYDPKKDPDLSKPKVEPPAPSPPPANPTVPPVPDPPAPANPIRLPDLNTLFLLAVAALVAWLAGKRAAPAPAAA